LVNLALFFKRVNIVDESEVPPRVQLHLPSLYQVTVFDKVTFTKHEMSSRERLLSETSADPILDYLGGLIQRG
jgi:hypothetical protein